MKISLNWLKQYVDIPDTMTPKEIADLLTARGLEVESITIIKADQEDTTEDANE